MVTIFQFFHNGWHWYFVSVDTQKTGDPNFWGGVSNLKFFHIIWSIFMKWHPFFNFFIMADTDMSFSLIFRKLETQTFDGQYFFCTINIYVMAVIFQFFHNGQCWYFISVDPPKTRDPNFGGVNNLTFFCMINIYKNGGNFSLFFIMADADIPFLSKPEIQT